MNKLIIIISILTAVTVVSAQVPRVEKLEKLNGNEPASTATDGMRLRSDMTTLQKRVKDLETQASVQAVMIVNLQARLAHLETQIKKDGGNTPK